MRDGIIAYNKAVLKNEKPEQTPGVQQLIKEGKLSPAKNGLLEADKAWYKTLQAGDADAIAVADALKKGFEMAKGNSTNEKKAPKQETEETKAKRPKFNPEAVEAALFKANSQGIDSLTEVEKTMVCKHPATRQKRVETVIEGKTKLVGVSENGKAVMEPNPYADRIGLTIQCWNSITGVINTYQNMLKDRSKISALEADQRTATLQSAKQALESAQKSMGITPKTPELEKEAALAPAQE